MKDWLGLRWLRLRDWLNWHAPLLVPVRRSRFREAESEIEHLREDMGLLIRTLARVGEAADYPAPPAK